MYAFKHKEDGSFLHISYECDNWGNNTKIVFVMPQYSTEFDDIGTVVFVHPDREVLERIERSGQVNEYTRHTSSVGDFKQPVNFTDMTEYEIVQLGVL